MSSSSCSSGSDGDATVVVGLAPSQAATVSAASLEVPPSSSPADVSDVAVADEEGDCDEEPGADAVHDGDDRAEAAVAVIPEDDHPTVDSTAGTSAVEPPSTNSSHNTAAPAAAESAVVLAEARQTIAMLVEEVERLHDELSAVRFGQQPIVMSSSFAATTTIPTPHTPGFSMHDHHPQRGTITSSYYASSSSAAAAGLQTSPIPLPSIESLKRTVQVRNKTIQALQKQLASSQEKERQTLEKLDEAQCELEKLRRREDVWSKELQAARRESQAAAAQASAWKASLDETTLFMLTTLQRWKAQGGDPGLDGADR